MVGNLYCKVYSINIRHYCFSFEELYHTFYYRHCVITETYQLDIIFFVAQSICSVLFLDMSDFILGY